MFQAHFILRDSIGLINLFCQSIKLKQERIIRRKNGLHNIFENAKSHHLQIDK